MHHEARGTNIHAPAFFAEVAGSGPAVLDASRLVRRVYKRRLALDSGFLRALATPDCRVVLVRDAARHACATLTMQSAGFAPGCVPYALELEQVVRLDDTLVVPREQLAEIRRVASIAQGREAVDQLYDAAIRACKQAGVSHWLGLVESGDRCDAADALWESLRAEGLTLPSACVFPRAPLPARTRRSAEAMVIPPRIWSFVNAVGARVCGRPCVHPAFPKLVTPMLADLRQHPSWL